MVGRDEGAGDKRQDVQGIRDGAGCGTISAAGASIPDSSYQALAQGTWPTKNDPVNNLAAQATSPNPLDDSWRSGPLSMESPQNASFGQVFLGWLVYWL